MTRIFQRVIRVNPWPASSRLPPALWSPLVWDQFLLGGSTFTPAGAAAPAVRADTKAADQRPGTSRGATRRTLSGECSRWKFLFRVENPHAKRQIAPVEFRHALVHQHGIQRFHYLPTFALNRLKYAQLDLPMVAHVRSDCQLFPVPFHLDCAAFNLGYVGRVTTREGESKFHGPY